MATQGSDSQTGFFKISVSAALIKKRKKIYLSNALHLHSEAGASLDQNLSYSEKSVMDLGSPECSTTIRQQAERKLAASPRAFFGGSPPLVLSERYHLQEFGGRVNMLWHSVFVIFSVVFCTDAVRIYCYRQ